MGSKYKIKPMSTKGLKRYSLLDRLKKGDKIRLVSVKRFAKPLNFEQERERIDDELLKIKAQEYERGLADAKPKVTKEFVEKYAEIFRNLRSSVEELEDYKIPIKVMFEELDCEMEE